MPRSREREAKRLDRRAVLGAGAGVLALAASGSGLAQVVAGLAADDGSPIRAFRGPDEKRLLALPGVLTVGPKDAGVTIVEAFDYNCGYCRQASQGLDQILGADRSIRLAFVHNAILSPASLRAAEAVVAVQTALGAPAAYRLHRRLLETPGRADQQAALELARADGLDVAKMESAMADAQVVDAVRAQKLFASDNRLRYTPTFVMAGVGFIGWPGVSTMQRFAAAARECGALRCDPARSER